MENIDYSQVLPDGVIPMISAGGILMLSAIIVMIIIIAKRWKGRGIPLLLGVISYIVFVFVCSNLITSAIAMLPGADAAFTGNPATYNVIYNIVTVIAFTVARVVMAYMFIGRYERKGDIFLGGIGLAIGNSVLYGATAISYYTWCSGIQYQGLESLFEGMTQEQISSTYESIAILYAAPAFLWLLEGIVCILDVVLNIALMNVVFGTVKGSCPKWMIGITAIINFVSSISFQLYNHNSETSIILWFGVKLIIFIAAMYYLFSIAGKEIQYSED